MSERAVGNPGRVDLYSVLAMYAISLGLIAFDQLLPAIIVGSIATLWALWAYRRSLFGSLLRKVRLKPYLVSPRGKSIKVPADQITRDHLIEVRPRIWHEVVIEMDLRVVRRRGDKRENYDPVPASVIGIEKFALEPGAPSRERDGVVRPENNAVVVTYANGNKLDLGRGITFTASIVGREQFRGFLSVRIQTKDDQHMLLTQIPLEATAANE